MQSIYSYQNYRKYLADFYSFKKKKDPLYAYKNFSDAAGIKSPNYLALIIKGTRNLTTTNIQQFALALKFRSDEIQYFESLVHFNQSKTAVEMSFYKKRLFELKTGKPSQIEKTSPIRILEDWFSIGVLVLAHGRSLEEAVSKCEAELKMPAKSIHITLQNLLELELLALVGGQLKISSQQMTFHDPKSLSQIQETYLYSQLERSVQAFRKCYKQKTAKFLSHTLTVPKNATEEIQKEFLSFIENLTQKMDSELVFGEEELSQINIQIFRPQILKL